MGGDSFGQSGAQSPLDMLASYATFLPLIEGRAAGQIPKVATQQAVGSGILSDATNAQNLAALQKYGLPEAQIGQAIQRSNALAGGATNLAQLQGAGGDSARAATSLTNELNPALAAANRGATSAVNAINLNGLSPGEHSAVERSLNQSNQTTGNLGLDNATNMVSNAMNFGGAFNSKVGLMEGAANSAANAGNAMTGAANPSSIALGQPNPATMTNSGVSQFSNAAPLGSSAAGNAFGFGGGMLNSMTSGNNAALGAGASMANATSPAAYLGAVCCFIFMEAYNGKLPKCVRRGRDLYYSVNRDIATGYRMTAYYLVPLMKASSLIRFLVWHLMVHPITVHLQKPRKGWRKLLTHFYLRMWAIMGKGRVESHYAMRWQYV